MHRLLRITPNKRYYTIVAILISILLFGFILRQYKFASLPRHGATFDEFAWTWLGINLIQKHTPISWSSQPQYKNREHLIYQGAAFWIVKPYLEHPPLFGIVAGSFAISNGVKDMYHVTLEKIRPLALVLGVISILMVYILATEIYGFKTGMLASLVYASVPTIVIGSRIVQNENFLIPFWLLSIYLISRFIKTNNKWFRNIAAVIAGLLSISKVPWLTVGLSLFMILSFKGKWRDAFWVALIVLILSSSYIIYGFYLDKELFINLLQLQTARYDINFAGFFSIFTKPLLVDRYYLDGWIFFGWFSIFFLFSDFKKHFLILIPFISYLLIYVFAIPDEPAHGWYRFPFYPFLIISSVVLLKNELSKISLSTLFFVLMVGLSFFANTWQQMFGFSIFIYRLFIIFAFVSVLLFLWFPKYGKISKIVVFFWIFTFIALNAVSVVNYLE